MPIRLPQDITRLRAECARRFRDRPLVESAIGEILRCIDEEVWADEQGVPAATVDLLNKEISPALDSVFEAPSETRLRTAVDNLVVVWRRIQPLIELA